MASASTGQIVRPPEAETDNKARDPVRTHQSLIRRNLRQQNICTEGMYHISFRKLYSVKSFFDGTLVDPHWEN